MTVLDIAHQRLVNQHLAQPTLKTAGEVVTALAAVQAQDYAGAKWALGMRTQNATEPDIERAFNDGTILRTHVLRPTWHFVAPNDIRWLLALTSQRVHMANGTMYRKSQLNNAIFRRSNAALAKALHGGNQLTRDELCEVLKKTGVSIDGEFRMTYIMMQAELEGVVCSGARRGNQFTYSLLDERAPAANTLNRDEALIELAGRYFRTRGPATVQDFANWSGLTLVDARAGVEANQSQLEHAVVGKRTYWFTTSRQSSIARLSAAHLLSIYDEYISGYKDRSDIVGDENSVKLQTTGNALSHVIIVDGQIVGTWKRTFRKDAVAVQTATFSRLTKAESRAVAVAARRYGDFLRLPIVLT
jgi:hypothetical protein